MRRKRYSHIIRCCFLCFTRNSNRNTFLENVLIINIFSALKKRTKIFLQPVNIQTKYIKQKNISEDWSTFTIKTNM